MGSLRKSLEKAGYLNPIALGFQEFLKKRREGADQDQFNQIMSEAINKIRQSYSQQPEDDMSWVPGGKTRLADLQPKPPQRPELPPGDPADTNLAMEEGYRPNIPTEEPEMQMLGDVSGRKYGSMTADEQRMRIQQSIADALIKASQLKNLPEGKLAQGTSILDITGKGYTPKQTNKDLKQFDTKKDLYEIDDDGNFKLISKGIPESNEKSIGSYTGKDGYSYTKLYDPVTKTIREVKSEKPVRPPKGTTVKIEYPKPEKWKDFGSVINMITYKEDPTTGELSERTPAEQKQYREVGQNIALGNMLPGAVDFMRSRIWNTWNRENLSQADFEAEVEEGLISGELSAEEAQDLLDYNQFRPFLYDTLIESTKVEGEE